MQGLSLNRDQPVKIEANTLEVRDKQRQATFSGKVKLTQGDIDPELQDVWWSSTRTTRAAACRDRTEGRRSATLPPQRPAAARRQSADQARRSEGRCAGHAEGSDRKGDNGVFDIKANTITLTGNVVVTQGTERAARRPDGRRS